MLRPRLAGFVQLFGSSVISSIGLVAIVSNRWQLLDERSATFLLLFIQWQAFCLTISKFGLEHVVFATVSRTPALQYELGGVVLRRVTPLSFAVSLGILFAFPPWAAAGIGLSVALDAYALMAGAELNARQKYSQAAFANLLNYPLFFVLVLLLAGAGRAQAPWLVAAFVATSAARFTWIRRQHRANDRGSAVVPTAQVSVALQQLGNYALFRMDQLLLGLPWVCGVVGAGPTFVAAYLFLAKMPELAAGVLNIVGTVAFPALLDERGRLRRELRARMTALGLAALVALPPAGAAYVWFWKGSQPLTVVAAVPFLVHVALVFPVNAVTYSFLSRGRVPALLRHLAVANAAGAFLVAGMILSGSARVLPWIVPLQLATFLMLAAYTSSGAETRLYGERLPRA